MAAIYKEYTAEEIVLATENFSWRLRSESVGIWGRVYKGYIDNDTVFIKFLTSPQEYYFESRVQSLRQLRHPHLVSMLGFCSELKCFVYEHIDNSLSVLEVVNQKQLPWHDRIRIARDICSVICYIKRARHQRNGPVFPDYISPSDILMIDHKLNAEVNVVLRNSDSLPDFAWDVKTFGYLVLNLLTGMPGIFISYCYVRWCLGLVKALDKTAGEWPVDLAEKLMDVCRHCVDCNPRDGFRKKYITVLRVNKMNHNKEQADGVVKGRRSQTNDLVTSCRLQNLDGIPRQFICPIYKELMKDPYVAADGFSYEREAIEKWLQTGHDTSAMTNLKLKHKVLVSNANLRLLIKEW